MDGYVSDRLRLPLLASGQAGKEATHNEALMVLDAAVQAGVRGAGIDTPPPDAAPGDCWIVGPAPGGAWTSHALSLAVRTGGGWRFVAPFPGLAAWNCETGRLLRFVDGAWRDGIATVRGVEVDGMRVLGARQPAVPAPAGGAVVDIEAREAIAEITARLAAHGLIAEA